MTSKNHVGADLRWAEAIAEEQILVDQLRQVRELQDRIDQLHQEQGKILAPLIQRAIKDDNPNKTMELVRNLPDGFHRTELRTHHINRMEDYEYRRRISSTVEGNTPENPSPMTS